MDAYAPCAKNGEFCGFVPVRIKRAFLDILGKNKKGGPCMLGSKQKMIEKEDAVYLEKALAAWKDAQNYFDNVSDPDLIEFAIYEMKAAQHRYEYMIKCAKRGEIRSWQEHPILMQSIPLSDPMMEETKRLDRLAIRHMMQQKQRLSEKPADIIGQK